MAFVNEYISADDIKKYNIEEINKNFIVGLTSSQHWTIDREKDIYLRLVTEGREEWYHETGWTFYWNGHVFFVQLENLTSIEATRTVGEVFSSIKRFHSDCRQFFFKLNGWQEINLKGSRLPADFHQQKNILLATFRDALEASKVGWGVLAPDDGRSLCVTLIAPNGAI